MRIPGSLRRSVPLRWIGQRAILVLGLVFGLPFGSGLAAFGASRCDDFLAFDEGNVPDREIHVAVDGSDTQGDGSEAKPLRSLARAASLARPGTAIRMKPGTYSGGHYLSDLRGTAEAPIWLGGIPGRARPVIQGSSQAIHLSRVRHLVIEHLEIARATLNGINCDDGGAVADPEATRFVVFRGLSFRDIGTGGNHDALKLSGVRDYWVLDSEFLRGSAGGSGIDHVGCHRGRIARCRFESMGSNAIQCKGGSEDIEIRACDFVNGGQRAINLGGSTGFEFFRPPLSRTSPNVEARDIRVVANVFRGSDAPVAFVGSVECLVANNTFVDPTRWIARVLQETVTSGGYTFLPCGRSRFENNLISFRRSLLGTFVNVGPNTDAGSFRFANNLWHARDNPAQSRPQLPVAERDGVVGIDPRLADPVAGEVAIPEDSPAAGKGLSLPEVRADRVGHCYAVPPSIGAREARPASPMDADGDGIPDWWERETGLDPSRAADADQDPDGDGASNGREFRAGTDPRDARSVLRIERVDRSPTGLRLWFPALAERRYTVERSVAVGGAGAAWREWGVVMGGGTLEEVTVEAAGSPAGYLRLAVE